MAVKNEIKYLECHAICHDWDELSVIKAPMYGVASDYRCTQCFGTKRILVSRTTGQVLSRQYYLPEDYRNPGWTKADYRKEWYNQKLRKNLKVVS